MSLLWKAHIYKLSLRKELKMNIDKIKNILKENNYEIKNTPKEIKNGMQIKLQNGITINIFDTGTVQVQGKNHLEEEKYKIEKLLNHSTSHKGNGEKIDNKVFVVYGHDKSARQSLTDMLRRWKLEPLVLDELPSEGQTIIEKLEKYTSDVQFAVVLVTPDDEGYRAGHPDEKKFRARQNIILELGLLLSKLGRKKVAILLKTDKDIDRPSDIQGLIYIPFKDDLQKEAGLSLAKEMNLQGYDIKTQDI